VLVISSSPRSARLCAGHEGIIRRDTAERKGVATTISQPTGFAQIFGRARRSRQYEAQIMGVASVTRDVDRAALVLVGRYGWGRADARHAVQQVLWTRREPIPWAPPPHKRRRCDAGRDPLDDA
jgi:hypothetical protein